MFRRCSAACYMMVGPPPHVSAPNCATAAPRRSFLAAQPRQRDSTQATTPVLGRRQMEMLAEPTINSSVFRSHDLTDRFRRDVRAGINLP